MRKVSGLRSQVRDLEASRFREIGYKVEDFSWYSYEPLKALMRIFNLKLET